MSSHFHSYISIPDPNSEIGVPMIRLHLDDMFKRFGVTDKLMYFSAIDKDMMSVMSVMAVTDVKHALDELSAKTRKPCVIS